MLGESLSVVEGAQAPAASGVRASSRSPVQLDRLVACRDRRRNTACGLVPAERPGVKYSELVSKGPRVE